MQLHAQTIIQTRYTRCNIVFKCTKEVTSEAQQAHRTEMAGSNGKAEAASYKRVLGAEKQVVTTTLKYATSQRYQSSDKNNLVFIRLNAGTAFAGLTGITKNRGDLYCKFFLI